MTKEDILKGESKNIEYKILLPEKSDKYLKSVVAFANTSGGKIIIGIDDKEKKVVGVDEKTVFHIMDQIPNADSDSCEPQNIQDITYQTIDGKCVVIVEIYPGANRPYYIKSIGKEHGTYIRVAGTSRPADAVKIRELEMEGTNVSWDELVCIGYKIEDEAVQKLCSDITEYMRYAMSTVEEWIIVQEVS